MACPKPAVKNVGAASWSRTTTRSTAFTRRLRADDPHCVWARVLRSRSSFGIYDVTRTGLSYPVPWATTADLSAVAEPERYKSALQEAGFTVIAEQNRRDFALAFFADLRAKTAAASGPPPLGLHVLMGKNTSEKVQNMIDNISNGRIAPVELIARKR